MRDKRKKKAVFNWSGGKDSALALQTILQAEEFEVVALLTTFNAEDKSSSAHSLPLTLLEKQAASIGIPLYPVFISKAPNDYEVQMLKVVNHFKSLGVQSFVFGDLYLEEVRKYREEKLLPHGVEVVLPLWGKTPEEVMELFFQSGLRAKIVTTQANKLGEDYIGKELDAKMISHLPKEVDICGENGEYHSFVYDGPIFKQKIDFDIEKTALLSFDIRLSSGEVNTYHYWQARFADGGR